MSNSDRIIRTDCQACKYKWPTNPNRTCKIQACKWAPMCHLHRSVEIKQSLVPNAGNGVFSRVALKKDETVGEYSVGTVRMNAHQHNHIYPNNTGTYVFNGKKDVFFDAKYTNSVSGMFNTINPMPIKNISLRRTLQNQKSLTLNAIFNRNGGIVTTKAIGAGDEIFVDYGRDYRFAKSSGSGDTHGPIMSKAAVERCYAKLLAQRV